MNAVERFHKQTIDSLDSLSYKLGVNVTGYLIGLRSRLQQELADVEKALQLASSLNEKPDVAAAAVDTTSYGAIGGWVSNAVKLCGDTFTIEDIRRKLDVLGLKLKTNQIATALSRLNEQGKLKTVRKKRGNIGAVYEKNFSE